jgi:hypothetical protein
MSLVKDIVFHGGRLISVSEGIDTTNRGWELLVGVSGIHHAHSSRDTAERVRAAQMGRVLDGNGSAGDFPYGYRSELAEPLGKQVSRGPKPKRVVVIDDPEAVVVRAVFGRFAAGASIASLVRWLNSDSSVPPVGRKGWHHEHVRRMLANQKYCGRWCFGLTRTVRDGNGRKKQLPVARDQALEVLRPTLQIVPDSLWHEADARLQELKRISGLKPKGRRRGPGEHYIRMYARTLLNGKVVCGGCGRRLVQTGPRSRQRLRCPGHRQGRCSMAASVPVAQAKQSCYERYLRRCDPHRTGWVGFSST